MIVEGLLLLAAWGISLNIPLIAKAKVAKSAMKKIRWEKSLMTPKGVAKFYLDEFVDPSGAKLVDFSIVMHLDGRSHIITKAEGKIMSRKALIENMMEAEILEDPKEWKEVLHPLFEAIDERNEEIRKSPTRFVRIE